MEKGRSGEVVGCLRGIEIERQAEVGKSVHARAIFSLGGSRIRPHPGRKLK